MSDQLGNQNEVYKNLGQLLDNATMRKSAMGFPYLVGHSQALGCDVSFHFQKGKGDKQARIIVRWPFPSAQQNRIHVHSMDEIEELLESRPTQKP